MASPAKLYQREMHDNVGFFATWLPADSIELGDVGVIQDGRFRKMGALVDLGIAHENGSQGEPQPLRYTSSTGTKIDSSAEASAGAAVGGQISVEFSREGAFLFDAAGVRQSQIVGRMAVMAKILELYQKQQWKKEWYVIESIYEADSATVIVAQDGEAGVTLAAKAEVPVALSGLSNPSLGLQVASSYGRTVQVIAGRNIHPLYSCLRLRDSFFRAPEVIPVRGFSVDEAVEAFARPSIDDLLNG